MLWFESLLFYGFEEHSTLQRGDGDISLLPAIVEKVILSKLTGREIRTAAYEDLLGITVMARTKYVMCIYVLGLCLCQCWQNKCGTPCQAVRLPVWWASFTD